MNNGINDELRREIAADLRKSGTIMSLIDVFRDCFLFGEGDSLALFVADLIDRPTCEPIDRGSVRIYALCDSFCCSNCGVEIDVHIGEKLYQTSKVNYCPWCGAEVVE